MAQLCNNSGLFLSQLFYSCSYLHSAQGCSQPWQRTPPGPRSLRSAAEAETQ